MQSTPIGQTFQPIGARQHPLVPLAQQLKNLDRCARTSCGAQRQAVKQQIDAAWRCLLPEGPSAAEAAHRGAEVASLMLGRVVPAADLHRTRRAHGGCGITEAYPFVAASLHALLDARCTRDETLAMERAFASMQVALSPPAWGWQPAAFDPSPPAAP